MTLLHFPGTGLGLWGMIKPDVVEYAGDIAKEKNSNPNLSNDPTISPELVKSTYNGGNGVGNDSVEHHILHQKLLT